MSVTPLEFWPESDSQEDWINTTITDAAVTFQIEPRQAVIYAFALLASETTLTKHAQLEIRRRIDHEAGKR